MAKSRAHPDPFAPLAYVAAIVIGSLGSCPTLVVAVISGTSINSGPADLAVVRCLHVRWIIGLDVASFGCHLCSGNRVAANRGHLSSLNASEYKRTSCNFAFNPLPPVM